MTARQCRGPDEGQSRMSLVGTISADDVELVELGDGKSRALKVNSSLDLVVKEALVDFLQRNLDIFAWKLENTSGIDPIQTQVSLLRTLRSLERLTTRFGCHMWFLSQSSVGLLVCVLLLRI